MENSKSLYKSFQFAFFIGFLAAFIIRTFTSNFKLMGFINFLSFIVVVYVYLKTCKNKHIEFENKTKDQKEVWDILILILITFGAIGIILILCYDIKSQKLNDLISIASLAIAISNDTIASITIQIFIPKKKNNIKRTEFI